LELRFRLKAVGLNALGLEGFIRMRGSLFWVSVLSSLDYWHSMGLRLEGLLRPKTFPVAVKLVKPGEALPEGLKRPLKALGVKTTVCQAFGMTRRYGWSMLVTPEDNVCPPATFLHGWGSVDREAVEEWVLEAGFVKDREAAAKSAAFTLNFCKLKEGECVGVATSPLTRTKLSPDVILVYCNAAQAFLLTLASLYGCGGALNLQYSGRHASCGHGVIQTLLKGGVNLVLPDEGDRIFAATEDDELIFAVPASMLKAVIEGLDALYAKGLARYPTPFNLRFQPVFPKAFEKLASRIKP